jgi:hypothetical protein
VCVCVPMFTFINYANHHYIFNYANHHTIIIYSIMQIYIQLNYYRKNFGQLGIRTHGLLFTSPVRYHYATSPYEIISLLLNVNKQLDQIYITHVTHPPLVLRPGDIVKTFSRMYNLIFIARGPETIFSITKFLQ